MKDSRFIDTNEYLEAIEYVMKTHGASRAVILRVRAAWQKVYERQRKRRYRSLNVMAKGFRDFVAEEKATLSIDPDYWQ